ncbi:MAG TPA: DoxX family protein [Chloroflexota bacterium]|jgi:uncharacterized membrane protein YphA (DoxX/SURF4 family)|nr:DoxX family protein [Chloroflexota bacterium]
MLITGRQGLALVRMGLGVLLLISAMDKLGKGWLRNGDAMTQTIQQTLPKTEAFYKPFLEGTVLPNATMYSQLVAIGELVSGVSLVLGLFTRLGAIVCMWLMLNYMAMKGTMFHQYLVGPTYSDRIYFVVGLACALAGAGLALGLDRALGPWIARVPVLNWLAGYPIRMSRVTAAMEATGQPLPLRRERTIEERPIRRAA